MGSEQCVTSHFHSDLSMTARSRFLAWLIVPALALCSLAVSANSPEGAAQALHLIDYIGADYPPTVENGKVIDETEYREQLEFLAVLKGLIAECGCASCSMTPPVMAWTMCWQPLRPIPISRSACSTRCNWGAARA